MPTLERQSLPPEEKCHAILEAAQSWRVNSLLEMNEHQAQGMIDVSM
jgi:hypothetical protein